MVACDFVRRSEKPLVGERSESVGVRASIKRSFSGASVRDDRNRRRDSPFLIHGFEYSHMGSNRRHEFIECAAFRIIGGGFELRRSDGQAKLRYQNMYRADDFAAAMAIHADKFIVAKGYQLDKKARILFGNTQSFAITIDKIFDRLDYFGNINAIF